VTLEDFDSYKIDYNSYNCRESHLRRFIRSEDGPKSKPNPAFLADHNVPIVGTPMNLLLGISVDFLSAWLLEKILAFSFHTPEETERI